jgi:DNA-directed RNA polymerase subunit beta'
LKTTHPHKDFITENDRLYGMKVVEDAGDSKLKPGQIISTPIARRNSLLKRTDKNLVTARRDHGYRNPVLRESPEHRPDKSFLCGIVPGNDQSIERGCVAGKVDLLEGLKENVIVGHRIPAGTGMREYDNTIVGSKDDYNEMMANKEEYIY